MGVQTIMNNLMHIEGERTLYPASFYRELKQSLLINGFCLFRC